MSRTVPRNEKLADHAIHVVGIASGTLGAIGLLWWAASELPWKSMAALLVYCFGLLAMLSCSGAYHMSGPTRFKGLLRRLDHAAIFVKIAATYTPFAFVKMGGPAGTALLVVVWGVALAGAAAKLLIETRWERLALVLYLILGWSGIAAMQPLAAAVEPAALMLLAIGGAIYSAGVVFYLWQSLPYHNALWHLFVLVGTACHFGAVAIALAPA
jgi:hemolysin III